MDQFALAATALTARADAKIDFIGLGGQPFGTMSIAPAIEAPRTVQLDEPQSLPLALIGAATLLAYRGLKRRIASYGAPSQPVMAAPRRAA